MESKTLDYAALEQQATKPLTSEQMRKARRKAKRSVAGTQYKVTKPNPKMVFDNLDDAKLEKGMEVSLRRELIWRSVEGGAYAKETAKAARRAKSKRARQARRAGRYNR